MANDNLSLFVRDRDEIVFDGEVKSVSSVNKKGKFDILPKHANFISLVDQTLIARKVAGGEETIKVDEGVLRVRQNKVEVYLGVKTAL